MLGLLSNVKVAHVALGGGHAVVCTVDGKTYTWGYGAFGQLGLGDAKRERQMQPMPVNSLVDTRVVFVAASGNFSAFCTDEGQLWMCGAGNTRMCVCIHMRMYMYTREIARCNSCM